MIRYLSSLFHNTMKRLQRTEDSVTCNNIYILIWRHSVSVFHSYLHDIPPPHTSKFCMPHFCMLLISRKALLPSANVVCEGYVFTPVCQSFCSQGECYPSMPCRWYPSMPCSRSPGGSPGPYTKGKLRGIWSRPTAKGEVEGDLVQAHTQGGI